VAGVEPRTPTEVTLAAAWAEVLRVERVYADDNFHALGGQPLYRAFDLTVAAGSITTWSTTADPAAWPPPRWTLTLG